MATVVLTLGLLGSGIQQLLRVEAVGALAPPFAWGIVQLGYPVYVLTVPGTWKLLGAVAILIPGYPLLKEWAYDPLPMIHAKSKTRLELPHSDFIQQPFPAYLQALFSEILN